MTEPLFTGVDWLARFAIILKCASSPQAERNRQSVIALRAPANCMHHSVDTPTNFGEGLELKSAVHMISINKNRATTPTLSSVLFELGGRAMPTKTMARGPLRAQCVVALAARASPELWSVSAGNAMEAANVAATYEPAP